MRLRRWEVRAVDHSDTIVPGLADMFNKTPDRLFVFKRTAERAAAFHEQADTLCHFYVVRIEEDS